MTERELSIIRALGEEFSTVLADLQCTFEGKMAAQAQAFEEKLASLSAVLQKHVTVMRCVRFCRRWWMTLWGAFRYRVMVVIMIRRYCSRR